MIPSISVGRCHTPDLEIARRERSPNAELRSSFDVLLFLGDFRFLHGLRGLFFNRRTCREVFGRFFEALPQRRPCVLDFVDRLVGFLFLLRRGAARQQNGSRGAGHEESRRRERGLRFTEIATSLLPRPSPKTRNAPQTRGARRWAILGSNSSHGVAPSVLRCPSAPPVLSGALRCSQDVTGIVTLTVA